MAECGECTMCCKLLGVSELAKPSGLWCQHCTPGRGCQIYDARPSTCRDFECGWLASDGPPELRPDKIHLIVTGESKELGSYVVHIDPNYPHAAEAPLAKALLNHMLRRGPHNIVLVTGVRRRYIGRDPGLVARLLEDGEIQNA